MLTMHVCLAVQGVKDISFSNDGRKFLSTSYDKVVKLWDTETGQVLLNNLFDLPHIPVSYRQSKQDTPSGSGTKAATTALFLLPWRGQCSPGIKLSDPAAHLF